MEFEWDPEKVERNLAKHGISFAEAATVFADLLSLTGEESRYIIIGMSIRRRVLVVAHTDRGERTRIISAREATRSEKQFYEEGH